MNAGRLLDSGVLNRIILCVTAPLEVKIAMGVIVAAPTAGACAALPEGGDGPRRGKGNSAGRSLTIS
jgi:L-serine deaminase